MRCPGALRSNGSQQLALSFDASDAPSYLVKATSNSHRRTSVGSRRTTRDSLKLLVTDLPNRGAEDGELLLDDFLLLHLGLPG